MVLRRRFRLTMQTLQLTVPLGVSEGQQIQVQTPNGLMMVVVPPGAVPGGPLTIQVPVLSPAPVVQQAPFPPHPMQMQAPPRRRGSEHATPLLGAVDPPEAPVLVPMGTPVADAMPKLPAALSLNDPYSGFAYTTESADEGGSHHRAAFDASGGISDARGAPPPMGTPVFYSDEELAALNQQPFPADVYTAGVKQGGAPVAGQPLPLVAGVPVAESAQAVISQPVLTTAAGMPVVNTSVAGLSPARTFYDGWNGITSCDRRLQDSVDELMLFLNTHNTRPLVGCQVEGWHHERRTRRRRVVRDGKEHWETESYIERVRDFMYKVDLTPFVYPFGFITSVDAAGLSVPDLCQKFVNDTNLLKSLAMKKEVDFDFNGLHSMVYGYIRSLGWRRGLTVSFPKANASVRVYHENWLSAMWENCCCRILCHLTLVPCLLMRIYRGDCCCHEDHAEEDVRSYFRINYQAIQVFEGIRSQLWAPGFSGAAMAMELLRNVFW